MRAALVVFRKEVRENVRDRRTLLNTLFLGPFLLPLLFLVVIRTQVTRQLDKADEPLSLPVIGAEYAPNLVESLKQQGVHILPGPADPERAVRERDADVVLRIPERYPDDWQRGQPAQVEIVFDQSQRDAAGPVARLRGLLEGYSQRAGTLRLLARGLSPSLDRPVLVAERDQSTPQGRAGIIFGFLPFTFIFAALLGGLALAVDTTAGERERQSLEPLMANPVRPGEILLGKLAATSAFATMTLALSLLAFSVIGRFMPVERIGMALELGPRFVSCTFVVMVPLAVLFSALQTLVGSYAKSYREAQAYLSLLTLVPIVPSMILNLIPIKTKLWMHAIPLMGQQVTITRLIRGESPPVIAMVLSVVCTSLAAVCVYFFTARLYRSERLTITT